MSDWTTLGFPPRIEFERYSCNQLVSKLQDYLGCPSSVLSQLQAEDIDGDVFLNLDDKTLLQLGSFSVGYSCKLKRLLAKYRSGAELTVSPPVSLIQNGSREQVKLTGAPSRSSVIPTSVEEFSFRRPRNADDPGVTYDRIFKKPPAGLDKESDRLYGKKYLAKYHGEQNLAHNRNIRRLRQWFMEDDGRQLLGRVYESAKERKEAIIAFIRQREPELEALQFRLNGGVTSMRWKVEEIYSQWFVNFIKRTGKVHALKSGSVNTLKFNDERILDVKSGLVVDTVVHPLSRVVQSGSDRVSGSLQGDDRSKMMVDSTEEAELLRLSRSNKLSVVLMVVSCIPRLEEFIAREDLLKDDEILDSERKVKTERTRPCARGCLISRNCSRSFDSWIIRVKELFPADRELSSMYVPTADIEDNVHDLLQVKHLKQGQLLEVPRVYLSIQYIERADAVTATRSVLPKLSVFSDTQIFSESSCQDPGLPTVPMPLSLVQTSTVSTGEMDINLHDESLRRQSYQSRWSSDDTYDDLHTSQNIDSSSTVGLDLQPEYNDQHEDYNVIKRSKRVQLPKFGTQAHFARSEVEHDKHGSDVHKRARLTVSATDDHKDDTDKEFLGTTTTTMQDSYTQGVESVTVQCDNDLSIQSVQKDLQKSPLQKCTVRRSTKRMRSLEADVYARTDDQVNKMEQSQSRRAEPLTHHTVCNDEIEIETMLSKQAKLTIAMMAMGENKTSSVYGKLHKFMSDMNKVAETSKTPKPFVKYRSDDKDTLLEKVVQWALRSKLKVIGEPSRRKDEVVLSRNDIEMLL